MQHWRLLNMHGKKSPHVHHIYNVDMRLFYLISLIQDQCDHLDRFITDARKTMTFPGSTVSNITRADFCNGAVIIITTMTAHDVICFAVSFMNMVADLAAWVNSGMTKNTAFLAHFFRTI